jgi:Ca2+/H+ antiporter
VVAVTVGATIQMALFTAPLLAVYALLALAFFFATP